MLIGVFFTPMYQRDCPEVKNTSGSGNDMPHSPSARPVKGRGNIELHPITGVARPTMIAYTLACSGDIIATIVI